MSPQLIDFPAGARVLELTSPAFAMQAPALVHAELVPDDVIGAMQVSWNIPYFPERSVEVFLLEDVHVAEEGLVFDAHGRLFRGTITQHSQAEIDRGYAAVMAAGSLPIRSGTFVLCKKRGADNFGHWLMEMLPKAHLARLYAAREGLRYVVPAARGQLAQVVTDSLAMLEIHEDAVLRADAGPLRVDRLLVVDGLTAHGVFMSPLVLNCIDALSARVKGGQPRKLYVTRDGLTSRRFGNEDAIQRRAEASGYTLLDPARLSFAEQVAAFKNATEIVGVMGAGLTNIAFAPRDARVLNLAPALMPDTFFWFIAGLRGQRYRELRCRQVGLSRGITPWDTDLALEPGDLDEIFPA